MKIHLGDTIGQRMFMIVILIIFGPLIIVMYIAAGIIGLISIALEGKDNTETFD